MRPPLPIIYHKLMVCHLLSEKELQSKHQESEETASARGNERQPNNYTMHIMGKNPPKVKEKSEEVSNSANPKL